MTKEIKENSKFSLLVPIFTQQFGVLLLTHMEKSEEQFTVVFALIVTEPASDCDSKFLAV
jgi:hypothetical protein